jgi:hypothetical protein
VHGSVVFRMQHISQVRADVRMVCLLVVCAVMYAGKVVLLQAAHPTG